MVIHRPEVNRESELAIDWVSLRSALLILISVISISIGLVIATFFYQDYAKTLEKAKGSELSELRERHSSLKRIEDLANSAEYQVFIDLLQKGFFLTGGAEQEEDLATANWRLAAEEKILSIKNWLDERFNDLNMLSAREVEDSNLNLYQINLELPLDQTGLKIYRAQMELDLTLLHEGYWLDFLQQLENYTAEGLLNLQQCQMLRLQETVNVRAISQGNVQVRCTLEWFVSRVERSS